MNTILGFDLQYAMVFHYKEDAVQLCEKLNQDREILLMYGFEALIIQKTRASLF